VILSIKDNKTRNVCELRSARGIPQETQALALRKLRLLNNARYLNDLRVPPRNYLVRMLGRREGQYSIRIDAEWRLCFNWVDANAHNVEIVKYKRDSHGS
jgi:proteic killer suppression protein